MADTQAVDLRRIQALTDVESGGGPVLYWMHREHRVRDNFGLLHAQELALQQEAPLVVVYCLSPTFLDAAWRQYAFLVGGLQDVQKELAALSIPFALLHGDPGKEVAAYAKQVQAGGVVCDFDVLRIKRAWVERVADAARETGISMCEVDSRNIVPCRAASEKREYAARTIRPRIHRLLPEFLHEPPRLQAHPHSFSGHIPDADLRELAVALPVNRTVTPVTWLQPGSTEASEMLKLFIHERLADYADNRNNPVEDSQSNLSPYLHFGHISALRVALEVQSAKGGRLTRDAKEVFLEELVVRRELSDNFCFYANAYDSISCLPDWARETLEKHRKDKREYVYDLAIFESGETHDPLWNAAQLEMVYTGKMHGYMRMYWAKKILEWTESPEDAMRIAILLNDTYELDGRDSNGYTGVAWSIGGVHDRPWKERPIFGKIRYMNANGCRRKFDVDAYIQKVMALA